MSDVASDFDALMELVEGALKRLAKKNPMHDLLRFCTQTDDDKVHAEFVARYAKQDVSSEQRSNALNTGRMYLNYLLDIAEVLGEDIYGRSKPKVEEPPPAPPTPSAEVQRERIPF